VLKHCKLLALSVARRTGLSALVLHSGWRRSKLLIVGYHGFSQDDEHLWNPSLYVPPDVFRSRLEKLRECGCNVLSLAEGLQRLYGGTLPPRSVVLTIDDGTYDAYRLAFPMLKEFGYPATLYLTTYYSDFQRPVFDVMLAYLVWKGRGKKMLMLPEVQGDPLALDEQGRGVAALRIKAYAIQRGLSSREKDDLLASIAHHLDIDYEALCRKRILYIMTREEARELAESGFDVQLHTHRHRVYRRAERLEEEITENARRVASIRGTASRHFCYPSGVYLPEFEETLAKCGIESAVTCWPGLAGRGTGPLRLPRLIDGGCVKAAEFTGWLSGIASLLPGRRFIPAEEPLE
jgi:peptidoglycan/xylan/chitin deacetylase (PgdA/CDA1 family)